MRRDTDFVRQILQVIEKRSAESSNPVIDVEGRSKDEVYQHLLIMQDRGLVEGVKHSSDSAICDRITWEGHEFLEQTRSAPGAVLQCAGSKACCEVHTIESRSVLRRLARDQREP